MSSQTWDIIKSALFEAGFVVLGVVLALGANEWRQARLNRHQAEAAMTEIIAELRANRTAAREALRYHRALMDTIRAYRAKEEQPDIRVFERGFIAPAQVYRTAWTSASETGALSHMDYADVLRFSKVYAMQEAYVEQTRSTGQIIYQELYRGGGASIVENYRNLASVISTFAFRERELVSVYDSTLAAFAPQSNAR